MKKKLAVVLAAVLVLVMALPAYAAKYTPSVEQNGAPSVVQQQNSSGTYVDFLAYDDEGHELPPADVDDLILVITPIGQKDSAPNQQIKDILAWAKSDIDNAADLTKLVSGLQAKLDDLAKTDSKLEGAKAKDLVVCDLFDVALVRKSDNSYVSFADAGISSLKIKLDCSGLNIALMAANAGGWTILDGTELSSDGTMTITLSDLGAVAFVRVGAADSGGKTSPQTGYAANNGILVSVALVAALVGVVGACTLADKKRA